MEPQITPAPAAHPERCQDGTQGTALHAVLPEALMSRLCAKSPTEEGGVVGQPLPSVDEVMVSSAPELLFLGHPGVLLFLYIYLHFRF